MACWLRCEGQAARRKTDGEIKEFSAFLIAWQKIMNRNKIGCNRKSSTLTFHSCLVLLWGICE